ncbi:swr complex subunit [Teratosphaeriaceae sp. CCFEE 6253]|nr:swr complex subunit [Teratosphaeriaceae sp. CCFEE 6253]
MRWEARGIGLRRVQIRLLGWPTMEGVRDREREAHDSEVEYDENADEDFNPDKAVAEDAASSSDDEEALRARTAPQSRKRKSHDAEDLDSGDEATIRDRKRKRRRKDADAAEEAEESAGEGGFVRTRAQRLVEKEERKERKRTTVGEVTINVEDVWAELSQVPIGRAPTPAPVHPADEDDEQEVEKAPTDEELVTITRRIEYAGEVTEVEELVPRTSKEAQAYLKQQRHDDGAPRPTERPTLRRPLKRPSLFEPNPSATIRGVPPEKLRLRAPSRIDVELAETRRQEEAKRKAEKMTTVQKSALDWKEYVSREGIAEELEAYKRSKGGYMAREDFLGRAELARQEAGRGARLKG